MKILLSLNYKFFHQEPEELLKLIKRYNKNNLIDGFEIYTTSVEDEEYAIKLVTLAKKEEYLINLHAPSFENTERIIQYLDFAKKISEITKRKINIVYHPIKNIDKNKDMKETNYILEELLKYIELNNYSQYMVLSIENLNDDEEIKRPKKEELEELLEVYPDLRFTFDIGHELIEGIKTEKLNKLLEDRLNNMHIHACVENIDHHPILNINREIIIKSLLEKYGYNKNIVMEYSIDYIDGKNFEEKLKKYIEYAKIIKDGDL